MHTKDSIKVIESKLGWKKDIVKELESNCIDFVLWMIRTHDDAEARLEHQTDCFSGSEKGESHGAERSLRTSPCPEQELDAR